MIRPLTDTVSSALPGVLVAALLMSLFGAGHYQDLLNGVLQDTDSYLRVTRIRELLEHGTWNAGFVSRDNAPFGFYMHWTKLFDLIILAFAGPFMAILGIDQGLVLTAGMISVICFLGLIVSSCWAIRPLTSRIGMISAGVLIGTALPLFSYAIPGRADHHIFAVFLCVLYLGYVVRMVVRNRVYDGLWGGLLFGVSLWATVETLPVLLFGAGVLFSAKILRYLRPYGDNAFWMMALASTFVFLVIDPSHVGIMAEETDRISIIFVVLAGLLFAAAVLTGISITSLSRPVAWVSVAILFSGAISAWAIAFPAVLDGPKAVIGEDLVRLWWNNIKEIRPADDLRSLSLFVGTGIIGTVASFIILGMEWRSKSAVLWLGWFLLVAGFSVLAQQHLRFSTYAACFGAISIGIVIGRLTARLKKPFQEQGIMLLSVMIIFSIAPMAGGILFRDDRQESLGTGQVIYDCEIADVAAELGRPSFMGSSQPIVLSEIGDAPSILYWTDEVRTVAGPYQRNVEGLTDFYAFLGSEVAAIEVVEKRGVTHVLLCPSGSARQEGAAFGRDLVDGNFPEWLAPMAWPEGLRTDYILMKIALPGEGGR